MGRSVTRARGEIAARLLVLGGTAFVGRAVVQVALASGYRVTTLNRGVSRSDSPGVERLRADRDDPDAMRRALDGRVFDGVIDVSGLAPAQVQPVVDELHDRTPHYTFVSTVSTYAEGAYQIPPGQAISEDFDALAGDPDDTSAPDMGRYGEQKRGCELAVLNQLGPDRVLIARPGPVLGPDDNVHRIPYWLGRMAAGGDVIAPGHAGRMFQFVDVRDLAKWLVTATSAQLCGTYNVVNPPTRDTWGDWLHECGRVTGSVATVHWIDDQSLMRHGLNTGFDLPLWFGTDLPGFDDRLIRDTGFRGRPLAQTVEDSWEWLRTHPHPPAGTRPPPLSREAELRILSAIREDRER